MATVTKPPERSCEVSRVYVAAVFHGTLVLYVLSCLVPAVGINGAGSPCLPGIGCLLLGWFAVSIGYPAWLAKVSAG